MKSINFKREIKANMTDTLARTEAALKEGGFGVLTRIDFAGKIKEKLGLDMAPTVILGACNPQLAYAAFQRNPDVTSLLPCNVVVRQLAPNHIAIEVAKPTAMMSPLDDSELVKLAEAADEKLKNILASI